MSEKMSIKYKKYLTIIAVSAIIVLTGMKITRHLLYHPYMLKEYPSREMSVKTTLSGRLKGYVVVFHGIYGEISDLHTVAERLSREGYEVINIQYPTLDDGVEQITFKYISPNIENMLRRLKEAQKDNKDMKIHFVTHSMGTGILRYYLKAGKPESLGKVVFLSPPSHGSQLSDHPISDIFQGTVGKAVKQFKTGQGSFINNLGEPDYECYIMIGNRTNNFLYSFIIPGTDDGMVPLASSRLDSCKYKVIEGSTHTSILTDERTLNEIVGFLGE